jgi:hypothetical protein
MTITTDRPAHAEPEHGAAPPGLHTTLTAPVGAATLEAMLQHFRLLEPVFDAFSS